MKKGTEEAHSLLHYMISYVLETVSLRNPIPWNPTYSESAGASG